MYTRCRYRPSLRFCFKFVRVHVLPMHPELSHTSVAEWCLRLYVSAVLLHRCHSELSPVAVSSQSHVLHRCMSGMTPVAVFSQSSFAWSTFSTLACAVRLSLISEQWAIHCFRIAFRNCYGGLRLTLRGPGQWSLGPYHRSERR